MHLNNNNSSFPLSSADPALMLLNDSHAVFQESRENRPQNTTLSYHKKQEEFIEWMNSHNFADGITVTGEKIVSFLRSRVAGRTNKRNSTKKIGYSTVRSYGAACIDLFRHQQNLRINSNPHPSNHAALKALFESSRSQENLLRRTNYTDRGEGTLQDGYTSIEELTLIANQYRSWNNGNGITGLAMFLLSHNCLMRGESVRRIELADTFCLELSNEGYSNCLALIVVMDQGKTNQFGRKELGACVRNKIPEICPVGSFAFYLFYRFHILKAAFPDFTRSSNWFDLKVHIYFPFFDRLINRFIYICVRTEGIYILNKIFLVVKPHH